MVEVFEACQQRASDLARKETCRARLQEDIQRVYAGVLKYPVAVGCDFFLVVPIHRVFLTVARLYLTGSSMNGLGCRSSDADLCLVLKGNVSISVPVLCIVLQRSVYTHRYPFTLTPNVFLF